MTAADGGGRPRERSADEWRVNGGRLTATNTRAKSCVKYGFVWLPRWHHVMAIVVSSAPAAISSVLFLGSFHGSPTCPPLRWQHRRSPSPQFSLPRRLPSSPLPAMHRGSHALCGLRSRDHCWRPKLATTTPSRAPMRAAPWAILLVELPRGAAGRTNLAR